MHNRKCGNERKMEKKSDKILQIILFTKKLCSSLLQIVLSVGVILIGCMLPLYFENGFATIGSDKFYFFRYISQAVVYVTVVMLLLIGGADLVIYYGLKEKEKAEIWWKREIKFSVIDRFMLLYGAVILLSYRFSQFPQEAVWGTNGWFMGAYTRFLLIAWYFMLSRLWKRQNWIWYLFMACTSVVFLFGILNRFGIYPINMKSTNPMFISTIGNTNWYCGWWSTCVFLGLVLFSCLKKEWFAQKKHPNQYYYIAFFLVTAYIGLGLMIGLLHGSDSGFLALFAGLLILFCYAAKDVDKMIRFWEIGFCLFVLAVFIQVLYTLFPEALNYMTVPIKILITGRISLILAALCFLIILFLKFLQKRQCYHPRAAAGTVTGIVILIGGVLVCYIILLTVNTLHPGSIGTLSEKSMFLLDDNWGSMRGSTWRSGLWAFWDQNWLRKLVGVGPDCMSAYIYSGRNPALEEYTNFWMQNARLTNAHGEWITVLLDLGILGLIGYAGMIISSVARFIKNRKVHWFVMAAAVCVVSYTANNIFSFQQTNSVSALFLILGIAEGFLKEKDRA